MCLQTLKERDWNGSASYCLVHFGSPSGTVWEKSYLFSALCFLPGRCLPGGKGIPSLLGKYCILSGLEQPAFPIIISSSLWNDEETVICSNGVTWSQSHICQGFFFGLVYLISLTNKGASICSWGIWGHSVYIQVALIINLTHTKLSVSGILFLFFVSCLTVSFRMQFATFLEMCYKLFKLTKPPFFPLLYVCFPPPQSLHSNIATECLQS